MARLLANAFLAVGLLLLSFSIFLAVTVDSGSGCVEADAGVKMKEWVKDGRRYQAICFRDVGSLADVPYVIAFFIGTPVSVILIITGALWRRHLLRKQARPAAGTPPGG